jgi:Xaa-Pro aminopeptidase
MIKPGVYEREIVGQMEGIALRAGCYTSFPTILTINGQILHNHYHGNILKEGQLVVGDSGVESPLHYASDITRTYPVSGKFSAAQKEIYSLVLKSQETAIASIKPGIKYKDVHLKTARVITEGLLSLGFLKGDVDELVEKGAHALFFPHGLGHMIGLDVHDMEDLGENFVGYDDKIKRSEQFGIAYLRFGRELKKGFALTVEPGIYFIPALIDKWKSEKRFLEHIDYDLVDQFRGFGGIRIEDDVVVTDNGCRVLGKNIPKHVREIEERLS